MTSRNETSHSRPCTKMSIKGVGGSLREPQSSEYVRLNSLWSWDTDFTKIPSLGCEDKCGRKVCNSEVFISLDPRLRNMGHNGETLALDNIPRNGKVQALQNEQQDIPYQPFIFDGLKDIHGGDVSYYYGKDLAVPFISQLFIQPGLVTKQDYVDPMGSYKPHYCRASLDTKNCLSWIRDSQFHREDLMSKQLWNRNQTDYGVNRS